MEKEIKKLTQKDLSQIRENMDNICEITGIKTDKKNLAIDHIHGSHKSIYPETNKLIRGAIHRDVNTLIGKIENQYLRSSKEIKAVPLPELLRKIADYLEKYSKIENFDELLIHPTEWKAPKIKKSSFNKLAKLVKEQENKTLTYPKSGKITKEIEKYVVKYNFNLEFY